MKCPVDGATLVMSERQSIEIDYCPECRGVWLDRGELDKIIERSEQERPAAPAAPAAPVAPAPAPQPTCQQPQQPPRLRILPADDVERPCLFDRDEAECVGEREVRVGVGVEQHDAQAVGPVRRQDHREDVVP